MLRTYVDILKFPALKSPIATKPSTAAPMTAPATLSVMKVSRTSRANASLDRLSFFLYVVSGVFTGVLEVNVDGSGVNG